MKLAEICSGKFYRCVKNLFTGLKARVKIQGHLSREIPIDSGVCQGSSLGPVLFLIFINDLLNDLEKNKALGVRIGSNDIPAFGFADDLTLLAPTPHHLNLLLRCNVWARDNLMLFHPKNVFSPLILVVAPQKLC